VGVTQVENISEREGRTTVQVIPDLRASRGSTLVKGYNEPLISGGKGVKNGEVGKGESGVGTGCHSHRIRVVRAEAKGWFKEGNRG